MKRYCAVFVILSMFRMVALSQDQKIPSHQILSLNGGYNQFQRGYFFTELELSKESSRMTYTRYNFHCSMGYNPWSKAGLFELKSYANFLVIFSFGGSLGYHVFGSPIDNVLVFKPQVGLNFMICSLYYGYNWQLKSDPNPLILKHNLTASFFIFGINKFEKKSDREFIWWGNLFR
ncbi:MAG: hypothetical protein HYZ14_16170 [Bacteroidetes bacterium]|nr:hypothetical protein [Bacteroidota bacterium]